MPQERLELRITGAVDPGLGTRLTAGNSAEAPDEQAGLIAVEQVRLLYLNTATAQAVTLFNGMVLAAVQSTALGHRPAVLWMALITLVGAVRIAITVAYKKTGLNVANAVYWRNLFFFGAGLAGAAWGAAGFLLFPPDSFAHQLFLAFVLGGMMAGAIGTMASWFPAFAIFSVLTALPAVARFLMHGDGMHYAMAWMIFLFLIAMLLIGHRVYRTITETFRLRFENKVLIEYLTRAKEQTDALNSELMAAQDGLRKSNEELENRVMERTSELSRANEELEKFAYVASHDLQEPLRTVANFSQLLEERYADKLDKDGREFIGYIHSGARHMRTLVDDLLAYSRLGAKALTLSEVDCEKVLREVLEDLKTAFQESGAVIEHDPLPAVRADAGQIRQLFANLLSNAIKFRGAEPLRIHVGATLEDGNWIFSVRDNGIGINPKYYTQIFGMYERLHSMSQYPGTGIGLALCKKIVEEYHGRIWVDSEEGRGSAFHFSIPCAGLEPAG
ncbi:MAG: ATP-binding protein [Burkholderiales bacterium]|nr:ATP-binding protein [Burkholderiales bacterium]